MIRLYGSRQNEIYVDDKISELIALKAGSTVYVWLLGTFVNMSKLL